ncbi:MULTISPECIES: hypothetical protein [unclassified Paenibacillus]|uniref:hypothetical protein n=1 Tax=unclassified Paenibacillus TaxID=185978 RepID=UPI001051D528|nr:MULTISPECIES: hypothetical protein [unclassified Paenibacillus]NIK71698.1 hypothetical protein [Paenibacillus sp. BK720]TCM96346.1 hypothetical protein EV294_105213 [Paenibacillus sp. BK033]
MNKNEELPNTETSASTVVSFNDATEHYQKVMGVPSQRADLKSLPKALRWFSYFFYTVIVLGALLFLISWFIHR